MKKTYLYMIGCAAALMMVGCAKDATVDNGGLQEPQEITLGGKVIYPESRTGLEEEDGGLRYVYWEEGDQVALVDELNSVRVLTLLPEYAGPGQGGYAMFEGKAVVNFPEKQYPVVYPASAVKSGNSGEVVLDIPTTQTCVEGGESLMYAFTTIDELTSLEGTYMEFVNLVGFLELQVVGGGNVEKVVVESASKKLSGAASLVTTYEPAAIPELTITGENYVELVPAEAVALNASTPTSFFVSLPAGTYPAGDLTITFFTETGTSVCQSSAEHVLEVSHIKPLALTAKAIEYIDLTAGEKYANSFIVSAEGDYSFDAKTKGGLTSIENKSIVITIGGENAQACCAWESNDGMITDVLWDDINGKIKFHYNGVEGNALVCLVAANGTALWSWHIWGTDVPADQVIGNNTYMDRNLGAYDTPQNEADCANFFHRDYTDAKGMPRACGVMYEWGRPVPFPGMGRCHIRRTAVYARETYGICFGNLLVQDYEGAANGKYGMTATHYFPGVDVLTSGGYVNRTSSSKNGVAYTNKWYYSGHTNSGNQNSTVSALLAFQRPMSFYGVAGGAAEAWRFWGNDLFTDGYDFNSTYSPWNYGEGAQSNMAFDVCPYGYHVPNGAEALADFGSLDFKWHQASYNGSNIKDGHPVKHASGDTNVGAVHATTPAGDFVWVPASGYRASYGLAYDDYMIRWWCSSNNDQVTNIGFMLDPDDTDKIKAKVIDSYQYHVDNAKAKDNSPTICAGFAIRCVKDK